MNETVEILLRREPGTCCPEPTCDNESGIVKCKMCGKKCRDCRRNINDQDDESFTKEFWKAEAIRLKELVDEKNKMLIEMKRRMECHDRMLWKLNKIAEVMEL